MTAVGSACVRHGRGLSERNGRSKLLRMSARSARKSPQWRRVPNCQCFVAAKLNEHGQRLGQGFWHDPGPGCREGAFGDSGPSSASRRYGERMADDLADEVQRLAQQQKDELEQQGLTVPTDVDEDEAMHSVQQQMDDLGLECDAVEARRIVREAWAEQ